MIHSWIIFSYGVVFSTDKLDRGGLNEIIAQGEGDFPFTIINVGVHSSFSLQMIHLYTLMLHNRRPMFDTAFSVHQ